MKKYLKLIFLGLFILCSAFFLFTVPKENILLFDANTYYQNATNIHNNKSFFTELFKVTDNRFVDIGYPLFLSVLMNFIKLDNLFFFQVSNFLLLFLSGLLIGKSISEILGNEKPLNYIFIFSPLMLSFAPKLYSEIFSIFGISLIIYGLSIRTKSFIKTLLLSFGTVITITTKSLFAPYIFLLAIFLYFANKNKFIGISFGILVSVFSVFSSYTGGRSSYNILIQTAKINQSVDTIFACGFYNISFPIGKILFPKYEGACYQNAPSIDMQKYSENPYLQENKNKSGLHLIIQHPIKFLLVSVASLLNIILFEGIYGDVIVNFPPIVQIITWVIFKLLLSVLFWIIIVVDILKRLRKNISNTLLLISPLLYFCMVVIFFPVEQRYFYPLIPYMYFLLGTKNKIINIWTH